MSTRSFYGSTENISYNDIYSEITSENILNNLLINDTCPPPQSCGQCGCGEYYCVWIWDATGEIEGSGPAWIGQGDGSPCPEECGECEYPSGSGTYDGEKTITYCGSSSPTTTLSP